ncbi:MAG: hypothetical protein GY820_10010 [Gammaproteobacteria bacterium]|nr:hypothetical protein [Gammaproteobacteria bacterium]
MGLSATASGVGLGPRRVRGGCTSGGAPAPQEERVLLLPRHDQGRNPVSLQAEPGPIRSRGGNGAHRP